MMSKKHYEAVAKIFRELSKHPTNNVRHWIGYKLADLFAADNPRFNRKRFIRAADIE